MPVHLFGGSVIFINISIYINIHLYIYELLQEKYLLLKGLWLLFHMYLFPLAIFMCHDRQISNFDDSS